MMEVSLNVLAVYSDREGAQIAGRVCASLRRKLGRDFQIDQSNWNAELLRSPKLRVLAAREAMNADLVIMAAAEGADLPDEVTAWLDLWRGREKSAPAALVALLKRENIEVPHLVEDRLQRFATSAHMNFFCHSEVQNAPEEEQGEELELPLMMA